MTNVNLILNKPYNNSSLSDFPDRFVLLDVPTNNLHGGGIVKKVMSEAMTSQNYMVLQLFQESIGSYSSSIYYVSKKLCTRQKQLTH
jgi:hypothetical protein